MKYRRKPEYVDAIQWTGDNAVSVLAFLGEDAVRAEVMYGKEIILRDGSKEVRDVVMIPDKEPKNDPHSLKFEGITLFNDDWLIRYMDGGLAMSRNDSFPATYEPWEDRVEV